MKYKKCRDCESKVGKLLKYCPHCGRDFIMNIPGIGWLDGFPLASEVKQKRKQRAERKSA